MKSGSILSVHEKAISNKSTNRRLSKKFLLGQLNSFGDCLYATAVARQIKVDHPDCHLTWAIGSMCRSILNSNPYVDEIWEVPLTSIEQVAEVWPRFEQEARARMKNGDFDDIFLTQIAPGNLYRYDGTIRSAIFHGYPGDITVPITPILRLSSDEVDHVCHFAEQRGLVGKARVILFESAPRSAQSFITPDFALTAAEKMLVLLPDAYIVISSNAPIRSSNNHILDGSVLSLRETAELTKYCTLLIGGSSGISWITTSDWAKPLQMIQLIKAKTMWFASFVHDHEYFGLSTDRIIEMDECSADDLAACAADVFLQGFEVARSRHHKRIPFSYDYFAPICGHLLYSAKYVQTIAYLVRNIRRHVLQLGFVMYLISWFVARGKSILKKIVF